MRTQSTARAKSEARAVARQEYDVEGLRQGTNKLECGPMPNVMAALPNIGGALCSMPQSLADAHY